MKQSVEFKSDLYLSECVNKSNIIEHDIICMISENCSEIKDALITICVFLASNSFLKGAVHKICHPKMGGSIGGMDPPIFG